MKLRPREAQRTEHTCPLCRDPLAGRVELHRCGSCGTSYHAPCAAELGGCSTLGCRRQGEAVPSARPAADVRFVRAPTRRGPFEFLADAVSWGFDLVAGDLYWVWILAAVGLVFGAFMGGGLWHPYTGSGATQADYALRGAITGAIVFPVVGVFVKLRVEPESRR